MYMLVQEYIYLFCTVLYQKEYMIVFLNPAFISLSIMITGWVNFVANAQTEFCLMAE